MPSWILLVIAIVVVTLAVVAQKRGWIDFSDKRQSGSGGGGGFGGIDEVFNPARHEAQIELDRQTILPAPAPLAGDGDGGIRGGIAGDGGIRGAGAYRGRVEINLRGDG